MWDISLIDERMKRDFGGDQSAYTDYLMEQIDGPLAEKVKGELPH